MDHGRFWKGNAFKNVTQGRKDARTQGRKDARTQGRKDARTQGRKDARTQGRKDARTHLKSIGISKEDVINKKCQTKILISFIRH